MLDYVRMPKLKIDYSYDIERMIAKKYKEALDKFGFNTDHLSEPAPDEKIQGVITNVIKHWEPKEVEFIANLNKFYDCDFDLTGWVAYLVRVSICPYWTKDKWFAVSFNKVEKMLKTIGHELFHQPFHLFWEATCRKMLVGSSDADANIQALKEALPELLNTPEFKLSDVEDKGHDDPREQDARKLIKTYYKENGLFTFGEFLAYFIENLPASYK